MSGRALILTFALLADGAANARTATGRRHLAFFGSDRTAPFCAMPGVVQPRTAGMESGGRK